MMACTIYHLESDETDYTKNLYCVLQHPIQFSAYSNTFFAHCALIYTMYFGTAQTYVYTSSIIVGLCETHSVSDFVIRSLTVLYAALLLRQAREKINSAVCKFTRLCRKLNFTVTLYVVVECVAEAFCLLHFFWRTKSLACKN